MPEQFPTKHHVYCDESSTKSRFMVYGGIITSADNVPGFDALLAKWRSEKNMNGELKWTKVSKSKLAHYKSLVDLFFDHAEKRHLHFKAVVFDTDEIDYATYHKGDESLGFYKFYYYFLLYKFGPYASTDEHRLWVFLDQRSDATHIKLGTLRNVLAAGIRKKFSRTVDVVRRVEARVSHDCDLMQIADVLMGAVGFHCNGMDKKAGASPAKIALAEHICKRAKLGNLLLQTPMWKRHFEIWRFKFSGAKKKSAPSPSLR